MTFLPPEFNRKSFYSLYYYFLPRVLIPKGKYNGQKLKRLVSTKTPAKIKRIIASVPEIK
jgi:hypothetical protein